MSLKKYQKKRDFARTPEPKGKLTKKEGPLIYVVQKHQARKLHYDFRLEAEGVLKSWAIPKGPSLNPKDKRLAVMVEDHPLEYMDFEDVIPEDEYGAGTVIVWDKGVYFPIKTPKNGLKTEVRESSQVVLDGIKKGELNFFLNGVKLKGNFVLIRIGKNDGKNWLLIKHRDKDAKEEDILKKDKSVISGKTIEQIEKQPL